MNRILFSLIFLLMSHSIFAQLTVEPGAVFHLTGNAQVTLLNMDLVNQGTLSNAENGRIRFAGSENNYISGNGLIQFSELEIDKSGTGSLLLESDIEVKEKIVFTSNHIDLNQHNIDLGNTGILENEHELSRVTGILGGELISSAMLNAPASENPGQLGAIISSTQNLGSTVIRRGHVAYTINSQPSIYRYYEIVPSLNNNLDAVLRFHYLDEELHGHIEDDLTQWRTEDDMNWIEAGKSSSDISANYVELTQIASFAKHSLRPSGVLPLAWGQVAASCVAGNVLLSWQTLQEQNNSHFLIQESESGQLWNLVAKLDAIGNSTTLQQYEFTDPTAKPFYRIQQVDLDGHTGFSKILAVDCHGMRKLLAYPNPVKDWLTTSIYSKKAQPLHWSIIDSKGALIRKQSGSVQPGENVFTINMSALAKGNYWFILEWADGQQNKIQLTKQ